MRMLSLSPNVHSCRPELDAENVNQHLDVFVSSILASINASIPQLLDQLTTESASTEVSDLILLIKNYYKSFSDY